MLQEGLTDPVLQDLLQMGFFGPDLEAGDAQGTAGPEQQPFANDRPNGSSSSGDDAGAHQESEESESEEEVERDSVQTFRKSFYEN